MKVLPTFSTVPEAVQWLSEQTESQWSENELLDFAASYQITLHAGSPISQSAGLYEIDHEGLRNKSNPKGIKRIHSTGWRMAEIFPIHIAQILHVGETETIHAAANAYKQKGELSLFEEPIRVTREQLRVSSNALHELLRKFKQSPRHNQTTVSAATSGAPENAAPPLESNDWRESARTVADEYFDRDTNNKCRDSLAGYSRRVMEEMQHRNIHGPRGLIDNPRTIQREALQGKKWWAGKTK